MLKLKYTMARSVFYAGAFLLLNPALTMAGTAADSGLMGSPADPATVARETISGDTILYLGTQYLNTISHNTNI